MMRSNSKHGGGRVPFTGLKNQNDILAGLCFLLTTELVALAG